MSRTTLSVLVVLTLVAGSGLTACGRKGRLEPPPEQVVPAEHGGKRKDPGVERPQRSLPIDVLLN